MNIHTLQIILILLAVAVLTVTLFKRFHLPPILGYLIVGILVGPFGTGVIASNEETRFLAEFGVVFLLFAIGLEFSLPQMIAMKGAVFGLGGSQVLITGIIAGGIAWLLGLELAAAFVIGAILALSSTAIVIKQLIEQVELNTAHGRVGVSILLFQDLAVIPLLVVIPILVSDAEQGLLIPLSWALIKAAVVFTVIMAIGHWALRPLFHEIARARSAELFTLTVLLVSLAAAWLTHEAGLSLALGAFLAGMMLGETEYRHQIEADIRPFQDVLLGLFFITVGMRVDLLSLLPQLQWVFLVAAALIVVKAAIILLLVRQTKQSSATAFRSGLLLAQGGEFGFVLLDLSLQSSLIPGEAGQLLFAAIIISMATSPFLIRYNGKLTEIFCQLRPSDQDYAIPQDLEHEAEGMEQHVIICGYGRIGQNLGRLLDHEGFPYVALDLDPSVVREAHEAGEPVHFGDATRHEIMHAAGIERAGVVVVTFEGHTIALQILHHIRKVAPQVPVLVRTKDDSHLEELEAAGAAEVMPEAVEASLMMGGQLLLLLKVPGSRILKIMREIRENHYKLLRDFYHGEEAIDLDHEEGFQERLHTVTLPDRAFAVGHTIEDLHLWDWDVSITAVRRGGIRGEAPAPETRLQAGDVLVLAGTAHHLEHAEGLLLYGL
ncbi:MAG: monovalent cation:proton antiporter-2 (CPA2) family protein [Candidatus Thiodiazotropha sp. (ex Lucina aurantia)]|nr:monovalent cation:proton antiporter-2 (CPA2) family protein [Candidatus Thiodiazotropha taylori]MBT3030735.1 monovalent cation:proton antiporter-2 (CPA2) family protein [Candidatus Thiodiazotropha sp. (ex Lucina pensylvanica)]MBT3049503.1 monovalent cation:proton antiporter-2 (CPA2) family protein [Candidatus Thiodiazotropha sp. (ex Codakia orbicularis)]MBV2105146.1 monovalent cation:proton antiporter-2 (CPA2) family protein [Candidatus Thiodiazotropha sp. (ex Lucina aurantia)]MBT3056764.1 m